LEDEDRGEAHVKVGKVSEVMFGFSLHDDKNRGVNPPCITLAYATQADAEAARRLMVKAFIKAKSATAPAGR